MMLENNRNGNDDDEGDNLGGDATDDTIEN